MQEILPGVWHWSALHPNTGSLAHSYAVGTTLLDPIVPEDGLDALPGRPEAIVLTSRHHWRSCDRIVVRFDIPVRVHRAGARELSDGGKKVRAYDAGDELAPGLTAVAYNAISPDDAALHLAPDGERPGALCFADGLRRGDDGALAFMPDSLLGANPERVRQLSRERLRPLIDLDFDALLFAHGEPLVEGGKAALQAFAAGSYVAQGA